MEDQRRADAQWEYERLRGKPEGFRFAPGGDTLDYRAGRRRPGGAVVKLTPKATEMLVEEALDEIGWRRRNGLDEYEIVEELPRRQQERSSWWIVLLGAILVLLIVGGSRF